MPPRPFGTLPSGEPIACHSMMAGDAVLEVLELGGVVRALRVPDRQGRVADVVLGFDRLDDYLNGNSYFGAIVGRIAGRVAKGRLALGGQVFQLPCNDGPNHLHGGIRGLHARKWTATPVAAPTGNSALRLSYHSPDGEEGYPGSLEIAVTYTLTSDHQLIINSEAISDRPTPLCLTHHSYFNLSGAGEGNVSNHEVQIFAEEFEPAADDHMTHSGRRERVSNSGVDFRIPRVLGTALPSLFRRHGDFYWLRAPGAPPPGAPTLAARVTEPVSGRILEAFTDEAALQFYTGMHFDGSVRGKSGRTYNQHAGLCLECQGHPDSANRPEWGDILVHPEHPQRRTTIYRFSTC